MKALMLSDGERHEDDVHYNVSACRPRCAGSRTLPEGAACLAIHLKSVLQSAAWVYR